MHSLAFHLLFCFSVREGFPNVPCKYPLSPPKSFSCRFFLFRSSKYEQKLVNDTCSTLTRHWSFNGCISWRRFWRGSFLTMLGECALLFWCLNYFIEQLSKTPTTCTQTYKLPFFKFLIHPFEKGDFFPPPAGPTMKKWVSLKTIEITTFRRCLRT